ncbi:hypothetical protein K438DRAFT_1728163 [Mycena galopus ATCC 62051]|nr:hypothetical protein K438DRAFT_1728163 [Mycena galopus ATCC 62051]
MLFFKSAVLVLSAFGAVNAVESILNTITSDIASVVTGGNVESILNTITSDIASVVTGGNVESILNTITSDIASVVTGGAGSGATDITSDAASVFSVATGGAAGVFETVTSIGGEAVTVVTSAGGQAITLAASGKVTSFAGSEYIIATGAVGATASGNSAPHSMSMPLPTLFVGLLTILTSACVGALITV